ncbi:uncharacterized protein LOC108462635 [Gossypium arboreum]|uniref:uncharacterized protein LOC108462635 n=1 Tax=Gossypium arboreum TaxID=29729 RepID=UPI000818F20D|nr:uncharacterized protein LOC108462635 [Gossypium arboreum]
MEGVAVNPIVTIGYNEWRRRRVNDNILRPNLEDARLIEEYLRVVPSELEIIRQDFEKKSSELEKKIKRLEEENVYLKLDVDVQKSEAKNLRKGKRKVEEGLASLKEYYKKCRASVKNAGFASLSKIEDLKRKVEELESTLQNYELQIERLEANNCQLSEQLHRSQDQVRDRDYLMGQAIAQIREVADYLQTLVVQADVLSTKYELVSDRGQELASLLRKVKVFSVRAKPYM